MTAPETMGPYVIERRLSWGSVGEVCIAVREGPGGAVSRVCLKRLQPDLAGDPELARLFHEESRVAASLRHPGIVQTVDVGQVDGRGYLAMELVAGTDLASIIAARPRMPSHLALLVALDVAEALRHAHELVLGGIPSPVVHGQVSPANILVSRDGAALVTDFGFARPLTWQEAVRSRIRVGEPWYRSPEQVMGGAVDARTDQFSLGIVLFQLLTGARPFDGADEDAIHRAIASGTRGPLPESVESTIRELVNRLLAVDPGGRFPTMAACVEAIAAKAPPADARRELASLMGLVATQQVEESPAGVGGMFDAQTVPRAPRVNPLPAAVKWDEQDMATTSLHNPRARDPEPQSLGGPAIAPPPGAGPGRGPGPAAVAPPPMPRVTPPPDPNSSRRSPWMLLLLVVTVIFTVVAVTTMIIVRGCGTEEATEAVEAEP